MAIRHEIIADLTDTILKLFDAVQEKDKRIAELEAQLAEAQEEDSISVDTAADVTLFMLEEKDKKIAELTEKLHNAVETADKLDDELFNALEEVINLKAKIYDLEHPEE